MPRTLNVTHPAKSPGADGIWIFAAVPPHQPSVFDLRTPGRMSALLSHDAGLSWPDRRGELIMQAVLAESGTIALLFSTVEDALACRDRLLRRGGR